MAPPPGLTQAQQQAWWDQRTQQRRHQLLNVGPISTGPAPAQRHKPDEATGFDNLHPEIKLAFPDLLPLHQGKHPQPRPPGVPQVPQDRQGEPLQRSHPPTTPIQQYPEAFYRFNYPSDFIQAIATATFTSTDPYSSWWRGIVGATLRRDISDLTDVHGQLDMLYDPDVNYTVQQGQAARHRSREPTVHTTMEEQRRFLQRLVALLKILIAPGTTVLLLRAQDLLNQLTDNLDYGTNPEYRRVKFKEQIFSLYQTEIKEFGHICTENKLLDEYFTHFYEDLRWGETNDRAISHIPMYIPEALARSTPALVPTPVPNPAAPNPAGQRHRAPRRFGANHGSKSRRTCSSSTPTP